MKIKIRLSQQQRKEHKMAIPTVPISMRFGEYSKRYRLPTGLPIFFLTRDIPVNTFPEAAVSLIRMKLAVNGSLHLFSPMNIVAFRYPLY